MAQAKTEMASVDPEAQQQGDDDSPALSVEPAKVRLAVKLPPKQRIVVDLLAAGVSGAEAAQQVGVDEATVSRWRNHDAKFIAAFNALNLDNIKTSHADMALLLPLASKALRKELEKGNGWLALQFIREAKSLGVFEVRPTSPAAVEEELKLAQQIHEAELMKKQLQLREQQQELEELREKLDRAGGEKRIEAAKIEGHWYAWMAFYAHWSAERSNPIDEHNAKIAKRDQEQRQDTEDYYRARREWPEETSRQIIEAADRHQREDQEKKQRGEHVKPIEQQASELHDRNRQLHAQCAKEQETLEQKASEVHPDEEGAADQRRAVEPIVEQQQVATRPPQDGQPKPQAPQQSTELQADADRADPDRAEPDRADPEQRAAANPAPTPESWPREAEPRPAAARRSSAENPKESNPDIGPFDSPARIRSEQDPSGEPSVEIDPDAPA